MLIDHSQQNSAGKLGFNTPDLFKQDVQLINTLVARESKLQLSLDKEKEQLKALYKHLKQLTAKIDITLAEHTTALQVKAIQKIDALEKKMLRAEKRKFETQSRQINKLKQQLFPGDNLQERVDNFSPFYAKYGKEWLTKVYEASLSLEQEFTILKLS